MKRIVPIAGLFLFALVVIVASPAASDDAAAGEQVFLDQKCSLCHSVSSAGIEAKTRSEALKGPDLVNVGERHEEEWIGQWLRREVEMNGQKHKKMFSGDDEELATLIDWLLQQKS
ncbi:MAG: c-type cytochrome [Acidobacteriota bacterium]|jgi:mono/diheme cytochrome c family protein